MQVNNYNILWAFGYGNGTFVAVGANGVLTSTNAVDWQYRSFPAMTALQGVVYAQGTFVVVGDSGTILQSGYCGPPTVSGQYSVPGGFGFSVRGEAGRQYRIQASTNLNAHDWIDLNEFTAGESGTPFLESTALSPQRFYRIRQVP